MITRGMMMLMSIVVVAVTMMSETVVGFSVTPRHQPQQQMRHMQQQHRHNNYQQMMQQSPRSSFSQSSPSQSTTQLFMSDRERSRSTKKGVTTIEKDKVESQAEQQKNKEEMWRVVLHNDEVHTFNYVIRSLTKVIGTLDRKAAFEVCVQVHGVGKGTVTKTWKKQAEQFCLGLQRQGLTVSISPDEDFDGGHSGGGL